MRCRVTGTHTLVLGAGGSLVALLLSGAVASADDYQITPDPNVPETVTGLYGMFGIISAGSALNETVQGYQVFNFVDTDNNAAGSFDAAVATIPYLSDSTNREILVLDPSGAPVAGAPPPGSIFDTANFGFGFQNVYADIASPSGDKVTDTLVTPFGSLDLTWLFGGFDASEGLATGSPPSALPPGIEPISGSPPVFTSVSALPPVAVGVGGEQQFQVVGADGNIVGTFEAMVAYTQDSFGWNTEAILVTKDLTGPAGTGQDEVPPVGSVFNTAHDSPLDLTNVYSDLASTAPGKDVISDTVSSPLLGIKNLDLSWLFPLDASAGLADHSPFAPFEFADDYQIRPDPNSPEVFTAINGLPPFHVVVQGHQQFDLVNSNDTVVGTFYAEETTGNVWGTPQQALIVTSDESGTPGTATGDIPLQGSVFNVSNLGAGVDLVYSDLVSTTPGKDVVSETLVTPLGNLDLSWLAQGINAAAGMADVLFAYS